MRRQPTKRHAAGRAGAVLPFTPRHPLCLTYDSFLIRRQKHWGPARARHSGGDRTGSGRPLTWVAVVAGRRDTTFVSRPQDRQVFWTTSPPSTGTIAPLTNELAGSTKLSVMWATSSGSP